MFGKTKLEVLNKIQEVENKLDIVLTMLECSPLNNCCNCREKEKKMYNELKDYLEVKLNDMEKEFTNKQSLSVESLASQIKEVVQNLFSEVITTCKNIIESKPPVISSTQENNIDSLISKFDVAINKQQSNVEQLEYKIDSIHFENEVIKHQLMLEEEIRKYDDELTMLRHKVNESLKEIDETLKVVQDIIAI